MPNIKVAYNYFITEAYYSKNDNISFQKYDIIEVKEIRDAQCLVERLKDGVIGWLPLSIVNTSHIDKLETFYNDHYSLACHLNPRLSESNFTFHDIFWSKSYNIMRKREVKLCKFIKILSISNRNKEKQKTKYLIQCSLYDVGSKAGRQIVSNIHSIPVSPSNNSVGSFFSKQNIPTFLLRSNYNQTEVVLRFNIIEVIKNVNEEDIHELHGSIIIELLNKDNKIILQNKTLTYNVKKNDRDGNVNQVLSLKISITDVPSVQKSDVDVLPDVIICNVQYIPMFSIFRILCAQQLFFVREKISTDYINNDFIQKFLEIVDDEGILNHFHNLCLKYNVYKNKDGQSQFIRIFQSQIIPLICIHGVKKDVKFNQQLGSHVFIKNLEISKVEATKNIDLKNEFDEVSFLSNQKCKPLNLKNCTFQLCNPHSLD
uniref:SH3 domain-containing protein n=1 Tax=Parastrongyloides trichosuri TaxID=131310 RepID=A0A0N4ZBT1_PARTI